jgi:hypothetical protein
MSSNPTNSSDTGLAQPSVVTEKERRQIRWQAFLHSVQSGIRIHTKIHDVDIERYESQLQLPKENLREIETALWKEVYIGYEGEGALCYTITRINLPEPDGDEETWPQPFVFHQANEGT